MINYSLWNNTYQELNKWIYSHSDWIYYNLLLGVLRKIFILKEKWLTHILKNDGVKNSCQWVWCLSQTCRWTWTLLLQEYWLFTYLQCVLWRFLIFIDYHDSPTEAIEKMIVYIKKVYTNELYPYSWNVEM